MKRHIRWLSLLLAIVMLVTLFPEITLPTRAEDDYTDLTIDLQYKNEFTGMAPADVLNRLGKKDWTSTVTTEQAYKDAAKNPNLWRHVTKLTVSDPDEGSLRKYLTSTDPNDTYISVMNDYTLEYHKKYDAWEPMVITTNKVLDLNGHKLFLELNHNRNNAKYDRYQNKSSIPHNLFAFEVTNGATLTIIDSSAWRGENFGKGTGELRFTGYMVSPFHYDMEFYTTRDLFKVTNGNLVIYGGTYQAGRKKYQSKGVSIDDFKTIVGNAVSLGVAIAEYATGCNTAVSKYQDILEAAKDAAGTVSGAKETDKNESDTEQDSGPNTVKQKDGSDAPKEKKEDTTKQPAKKDTDAGRNQTVQEKKDDKNKAIADGSKNATPEGSSTGNNGQNSTAKSDKNAKLADGENNVVKAFLDKDKIMGMVDSGFELAKGIKKLFTDDGSSKVCQSIKGTVVSIGNDGVFVCYGGTFNGYGSTPDTRNAVIECTRLSTRRPKDKTKFQGGMAYIYGGTFNAYAGANVFNMVKANNGTQTVYRVVQDKNGNRTVEEKVLSEQETNKLEILRYEDQENIKNANFPFTPIDTSNVQVRGGTFRCYYDLWNVAVKEAGDKEHFRKFPGTPGSVNLGPESFGNDLIQDGRIQVVDPYGDGALVLLDERTEEAAAVKNAGLYHYRMFCSSVELRAKDYLQVMPNEAVTNASASMQLATYQDNEKSANQLWQNDAKGDNIRTAMTQTERYFDFMYNDTDAANYMVMPNFHDTQSGQYDVYGKHLDDSEIWYYPTPKDAKNNPIKDVTLTDLWIVARGTWGGMVQLSQQLNDEKTWEMYKNRKNYIDYEQPVTYYLQSHKNIRETMRYFTYKMYRVDPLTRENLSESKNYGVDEPLFTVQYGVSPGSLKCKFPLLEVEEQIKNLRPDWAGYQPGEYYRIVLDIEEHMGIGYQGGTSYGAKMPVAHTTSTILFRCSDINETAINETADNGGAYKAHDFTPVQWTKTPKAGSVASVKLINGKAGMTDYAAVNKVFDLYYQWWEVDSNGNPVRLLAGTDNVYNGTGVKAEHKPSMWNVGKDGKTYVNTVDPSDPKASSYVNGLPARAVDWTAEQLHMYSAQTVEKQDLTRDPADTTRTLSLMNNNVFKTNTDSCYIPEDLAGKSVRVKVIAVNYTRPGTNVYDKKQTFWSHAFTVADKDDTSFNVITLTYPTGKGYASAKDPVVIDFDRDKLALYKAWTSLSYFATASATGKMYALNFSDLAYQSKDEIPLVKFPDDFKDVLDPDDIPTGEYEIQARYTYKITLFGATTKLMGKTNALTFNYEAPATGLNLTEGSVVEYSLQDVQNGVYSGGVRLIEPIPANASSGFDYEKSTTTNFSVAFMGADGLIRFGGSEGTTDITLVGPDNKPTTVTVRVKRDASDEAAVANTNLGDNPFQDVQDSQYYNDPVLWAVGHEPQITAGTDASHFSPNETCTRGQIVTFLWRSAGCPEPESSTNPFKDVKASDYYYKAVLWAVEEGVTVGTGPDTFSPGQGCTRGQVVTFLWRAKGEPEPKTTTNPFKDVSPSAYYYKAVLWAVENGVTAGTDPGKFSPDATCQRGQIVTFLFRADENGNVLRFTQQPAGRGLIDSSNHTTFSLSVAVTGGTAPYTYQWRRLWYNSTGGAAKERFQRTDALPNQENEPNHEELIEGATSASYSAPWLGWYECLVTDATGRTIRSARAQIGDKLTVAREPQDGYCSEGLPFQLYISPSGGIGPMTSQWYKDGQPIGDPDKSIIEASEPGKYYCVIKDSFGQSVTSRTATVTEVGKSGVNVLNKSDFVLYAEDMVYVTGRGLVVSGRVANGRLDTGDTIRLLTYDASTKHSVEKEYIVDGIEMFHKILDYCEKGDNVGLLLKNAEKGDVQRGDCLVDKSSSLHDLPYGAKLVGKVELNEVRSTPFVNGNNVQLYVANGTDVTCYFVDVNGAPIEKNTTRDGVVMSLASTAHRPMCFYPGQVLTIRVGGHTYGTFTVLDIQTN